MFKRKITKKIACPACGHIIEIRGLPSEKNIIICPNCSKKGYYIIPNEPLTKAHILKILIPTTGVFIILALIHLFLTENELLTILCFLFLIPLFILFNYKKAILIGFAIFLILLSQISLTIYNDEILVNQLISYAYWLLVVGVLCQIIESLNGLKLTILKKIFG